MELSSKSQSEDERDEERIRTGVDRLRRKEKRQVNRLLRKEKRQVKLWASLSFIFFVALVVVGAILYMNMEDEKKADLKEQEFNEAFQAGQISLIQQINSQGDIPVLTDGDNTTILNWINIVDICGTSNG